MGGLLMYGRCSNKQLKGMFRNNIYRSGKTVRYKAAELRHKDAVPYKRATKHKTSYEEYQ